MICEVCRVSLTSVANVNNVNVTLSRNRLSIIKSTLYIFKSTKHWIMTSLIDFAFFDDLINWSRLRSTRDGILVNSCCCCCCCLLLLLFFVFVFVVVVFLEKCKTANVMFKSLECISSEWILMIGDSNSLFLKKTLNFELK